jgi:hypothetical protein
VTIGIIFLALLPVAGVLLRRRVAT